MLKIFASSTSRDLIEFRNKLLNDLSPALEGVGMENFVPDGTQSQDISLKYLRECDIIIFLISPYYGSLIEECKIEDCQAKDCPMKTGQGRFSFTHCEYKTTITEGKLHQTYLILKDWDIIEFLKDKDEKDIDLNEIKKTQIFERLTDAEIKHYIKICKKAWSLKEEVSREAYGKIEDIEAPNILNTIRNHLAENIVKWHKERRLNFTNFCDRTAELTELMENIDDKVEVYGVGAVGKTSLIQVALLIQKLKGKLIITVGPSQAYASGSGYDYFRKKCKENQYNVIGNNITLEDIVEALSDILPDPDEVKKKAENEKIKIISNTIEQENMVLFIDDFHLANKGVKELVKATNSIILSSRKKSGLARKEISLIGIGKEDRENLINMFSKSSDIKLNAEIREKISNIAEGHPLATELLVRNYEIINFDKLKEFKPTAFADADSEQAEDFLKRVVKEILTNEAFTLLKNLSVINTDLDDNIDKDTAEETYKTGSKNLFFNELINTGMLKKKEGKEGTYQFVFKHIQEAIKEETDENNHETAIKYYKNKRDKFGENIDDAVEIFFHQSKLKLSKKLVNQFIELGGKILPTNYGFKRLVDIGEDLKNYFKNNSKAEILNKLGLLNNSLKRYKDAEMAHNEALKIYKELSEKNPKVYLQKVGIILNNLGILYRNLRRYEEAKKLQIEALKIYNDLAEKDIEKYLPNVAKTQIILGNLNKDLRKYDVAEKLYLKALKNYKDLAEKNPEEYLYYVARTRDDLGILYRTLRRFEEAEKECIRSLKIKEKLKEKNPERYLPHFTWSQTNLGNLYRLLKRFNDAKKLYFKALKSYIDLADKNSEVYRYYVAWTQNNLGILYLNLGSFNKAEKCHLNALEIRKELAEKNPAAFLSDVAWTQINLGNLYRLLKRFKDAEKCYLSALKKRIKLAEKISKGHLPDVAWTYNNLGDLYRLLKRFDEAEKCYFNALKIRKELAEKNPIAFLPDVAWTQTNLGDLFQFLGKFDKAEECYLNALKVRKELMQLDSEGHLPDVIKTQIILGNLFWNLKRFEDAEKIYRDTLESYRKLRELNLLEGTLEYIKSRNNSEDLEWGLPWHYIRASKDAKKKSRLNNTEKFYIEILEIYKKLAEKKPDVYLPKLANTQNNLGVLYLYLKRYEKAVNFFDKALEIDSNDGLAWYNKACIESLRNDKAKSLEFLKNAIELNNKYRNLAKTDQDFYNIRDSKEFKELCWE